MKLNRISEIRAVHELGEKIGYGNLMNLASALWAIDLESKGIPDSGAFVATILTDIKSPYRNRIVVDRDKRKREIKQRYFER